MLDIEFVFLLAKKLNLMTVIKILMITDIDQDFDAIWYEGAPRAHVSNVLSIQLKIRNLNDVELGFAVVWSNGLMTRMPRWLANQEPIVKQIQWWYKKYHVWQMMSRIQNRAARPMSIFALILAVISTTLPQQLHKYPLYASLITLGVANVGIIITGVLEYNLRMLF